MGSVYKLTLRQLAGPWRLAIMAVLATLPVIITTLIMNDSHTGTLVEYEIAIVGAMLMGSITPLVVLAIAAAAFGNEVEDRTLANLTLSPVPRWKIAVPKLLATITVAAPFIAVSSLLTAHIAFLGDASATTAVVVSGFVGVAMYAALFVWLGLVSTQAIGVGLLYIVLWEGFIATFVSGARVLSIRYYAIALMHGLDARRFASESDMPINFTAAIVLSVVVIGGFLMLSVRRLRLMDVP
jgi:ABC-2 type transport system permease protein